MAKAINWNRTTTKGDINRRNKTCRKKIEQEKILNCALDFTVRLRLIKKKM